MAASPLVLIDFIRDGRPARTCFAGPVEVLEAAEPGDVRPLLRRVERAGAAGLWAAGYLAYEAAEAFDPRLRVRAGGPGPLAWFALFRSPTDPPATGGTGGFTLSQWRPDTSRERYRATVTRIRAAIAAGDTYQVNLCFRLAAQFSGDTLALYERLVAAQPGGMCAFLDTGPLKIVSASPELFFELRAGRIVTRPMKGTRPRGRFEEEDRLLGAELRASEKDRAENLMIVDLLRNDLGRIALPGSVAVPALFTVERYPTVWQMTSTVTARTGASLEAVLDALFPCGSVTGAPKIATMSLIAELEGSPRGPYCGAIGLVEPGGAATFSVAIRTAVIDARTGVATYGVGGGVTWDSTADGEWAEALAKAAVITQPTEPYRLLETLRLQDGRLVRGERHLRRMAASARFLGFRFDAARAAEALAGVARSRPTGSWRVRLLLDRTGTPAVEGSPLAPLPAVPLAVALARVPVDSRDPFLFHKTTRRAVYEACRAERPDCHDVLLHNERGELTELTTANLVVELGGERLTPPRTCGLLAGVLRGELLERGEIRERVLHTSDLDQATQLWLVSSLRGWHPFHLVV